LLPDDDLRRMKHVGVFLSVLIVFMWNLYKCKCWLIIEESVTQFEGKSKIKYTDYLIEKPGMSLSHMWKFQ